MKRIVNKVLKAISTAIFVTLILLIALILFYVVRVQILTSQGKIDEVRLNFYTILTQSMYPTIDAGDIVVTYKNYNDIYKTGDIITFVSNSSASKGLTITHRVIEVFELDGVYSYRTQGDNNNVSDSASVPSKNVIGRVVVKVPKAGYIQQFLVTKVGWIVAIVVPCLAIIIYDILKMFRSLSNKANKKKKEIKNEEVLPAKEKLENIINSIDENASISELDNNKFNDNVDNMSFVDSNDDNFSTSNEIVSNSLISSVDENNTNKEEDNIEFL